MNATSPLFQMAELLKLLPFFGPFEDINMRFDVCSEWVALQLLDHHSIVKLRFCRNRCRHEVMNKMINEMLRLGVLPLVRTNGERVFAERIWIALAQL